MSDMIRCTACRGSKIVAKLGGIAGDCSLCNGTGKIKAEDKPVPIVVEQSVLVNDIIEATERVVLDTNDIVSPKPVDAFTPPEFVDTVKDTIDAVSAIVEPEPAKAISKRKVFSKVKTKAK